MRALTDFIESEAPENQLEKFLGKIEPFFVQIYEEEKS